MTPNIHPAIRPHRHLAAGAKLAQPLYHVNCLQPKSLATTNGRRRIVGLVGVLKNCGQIACAVDQRMVYLRHPPRCPPRR